MAVGRSQPGDTSRHRRRSQVRALLRCNCSCGRSALSVKIMWIRMLLHFRLRAVKSSRASCPEFAVTSTWRRRKTRAWASTEALPLKAPPYLLCLTQTTVSSGLLRKPARQARRHRHFHTGSHTAILTRNSLNINPLAAY